MLLIPLLGFYDVRYSLRGIWQRHCAVNCLLGPLNITYKRKRQCVYGLIYFKSNCGYEPTKTNIWVAMLSNKVQQRRIVVAVSPGSKGLEDTVVPQSGGWGGPRSCRY